MSKILSGVEWFIITAILVALVVCMLINGCVCADISKDEKGVLHYRQWGIGKAALEETEHGLKGSGDTKLEIGDIDVDVEDVAIGGK